MEKKAKIIATLGPAIYKETKLKQLVKLGVDAFRINFSHKTQSGTALTDYAQAFSPPEEIVEDGSRLDLEADVQTSLEKLQRQRKTQEATIQRQNDDFWDKEESYDTLNQKKPVRTTTI